jgi:hypothetical protein
MDLRLINGGAAAGRVGVCDGVFGNLSCSDVNFLTQDGGTLDAEFVNAVQVSSDDYRLNDTDPLMCIPRQILSNYKPRWNVELDAGNLSFLLANGAGGEGFYQEKVLGAFVPGQMIEYVLEGNVVTTSATTTNVVLGPWMDTTPPANDTVVDPFVVIAATNVVRPFSVRFTVTIVGVQASPNRVDYNYSAQVIYSAAPLLALKVGESTAEQFDSVPSGVFTALAVTAGGDIGTDTVTMTICTAYTRLIAGSYGFTPP